MAERQYKQILFPEQAAPATPPAGFVVPYAKADGKLYIKDDAGVETDLTATGAAGAFNPIESAYWGM
jgi:hypothetical protein